MPGRRCAHHLAPRRCRSGPSLYSACLLPLSPRLPPRRRDNRPRQDDMTVIIRDPLPSNSSAQHRPRISQCCALQEHMRCVVYYAKSRVCTAASLMIGPNWMIGPSACACCGDVSRLWQFSVLAASAVRAVPSCSGALASTCWGVDARCCCCCCLCGGGRRCFKAAGASSFP
jgi:hypothetical protein